MAHSPEVPPNLSYTRGHEWIACAPCAELPEGAVDLGDMPSANAYLAFTQGAS